MYKNLTNINKNEEWLLNRLDKLGYPNIDNILLATCDNKEKITVGKSFRINDLLL